jgi:UDP-MurNAc hydroxylase
MGLLTFVNHASFMLETAAGAKILVDPWVKGSAFADGWALIEESDYAVPADSTIVYSHEHPDHFSVGFLSAIPADIRPTITVLFQKTLDKKILNYCTKAGFKVAEISAQEALPLSQDLAVRIKPFDKYDSTIVYHVSEGGTPIDIINTNDCEFQFEHEFKAFIEPMLRPGARRILFTQFSYACWHGNPEERSKRQAAADKKLEQIRTQIRVLGPAVTVPFAAFIYFSHEENYFNNDCINRPDRIASLLADAGPIRFLRLGEQVELDQLPVFTPAIANAALDHWRAKFDAAEVRYRTQKDQSFEKLKALYTAYRRSNVEFLRENYLLYFINLLIVPQTTIKLTDLGIVVRYHPLKNVFAISDDSAPQIFLSAEALAFVFRFPFGWESIHVAGRFYVRDTPSYGDAMKAFCFGIYRNNNVPRRDMLFRLLRFYYLKTRTRVNESFGINILPANLIKNITSRES